ncbi:HAD hydrolase-like protein [Streptomyces sp. NPDC001920]
MGQERPGSGTAEDAVTVGDDAESGVPAAQRAGAAGVLVRAGT